jgi:hypothetical protein
MYIIEATLTTPKVMGTAYFFIKSIDNIYIDYKLKI